METGLKQQNKENSSPINNGNSKTNGTKTVNLAIDNIPYSINLMPFSFNGENRYYVKINEGDERVFSWDAEMQQFRAVDDSNEVLPGELEQEISNQLLSLKK